MGRQLFGTDGVRGVAGEYPLDPKTTYALGMAFGRWAAKHHPEPQVMIGMDTRESSTWIARQVAGGLKAGGVEPKFAGLITTPGVAYLTRSRDFVAGVMISASHNPYQDNGIKVFDHSGFKLPDTAEHALETQLFAILEGGVNPVPADLNVDEGLDEAYLTYLVSTVRSRFDNLKLVVDCANGAASELAKPLFERLGATIYPTHCLPDGRNINLNCGALHVENLRDEVLARNADAGVAFDGDADRCILMSKSGRTIDGDAILLILGEHWKGQGKLKQDMVVATVMSNLGLERALERRGITMLRTGVGDKYVLEEMIRRDAAIGGEQSGHVIFRDYATTGDGLLTALQLLEICCSSGQDLDQLAADLQVFPQVLVNVRVKQRKPLSDLPAVQQEIRLAEEQFGDKGRVLVRFSGTEPLARVMVEGLELDHVKGVAERIAGVIRTELGGS
ncbi:MAG TPA: phosphoglucosamine mutase [Bryobacteraceae bacterium]|nr:phosphoglucosamine mutase [Bryobacteraceae bacterium]